jgi:hypothetical protein
MKRKKHKPIHASVPMLVNRLVNENVESLEERAMLMAFQYGVATKQHYDYLVRMANMLNIANQAKPSDELENVRVHLNWLAEAIFERYERLGKFGTSGLQLSLMRRLVQAYDDYWKRQTTNLYNDCAYELNAFYADLETQKVAA